jgi:hypothetical protein
MKNLTLTLLLLCSLCSFAQTGFIEVTVTDTVWTKPISFDYIVGINTEDSWTVYPPLSAGEPVADSVYNEDVYEAQSQQKLKDLKAFLTKKKYTFHEPENPIPGLDRFTPNGIAVTLKTTKDLKRLKADLKTLDYVEGKLGGADFGDEARYDAAIYTKLVSRARTKAQIIGAASGQKAGKILEIKEIEHHKDMEDLNIYDVYFVFNKGRLFEDENGNVHGELTRTITVKFVTE